METNLVALSNTESKPRGHSERIITTPDIKTARKTPIHSERSLIMPHLPTFLTVAFSYFYLSAEVIHMFH
jgi:hypothetical protein